MRDPLQAYCDVLEEKWILSELAGKDVGLSAAMDAYLGLGAPGAGGRPDGTDDTGLALDIDWSSGWETEPSTRRRRRQPRTEGAQAGHRQRRPPVAPSRA